MVGCLIKPNFVNMDHKGLMICVVILGLIHTNLAISSEKLTNNYEAENLTDMMLKTKPSKANLTAITWAHAVNSRKELEDALNSDVDMIEADIVLGKLNDTGSDIPIMGHPPANTSDISLKSFLHTILDYNKSTEDKKGVKLDFKTIEVFEGSLGILKELWPNMTCPIWLNADIIEGPVNNTETKPVNPKRFFAGCKDFDQAVLSIGWTTRWGSNFTNGSYTETQIQEMIDAIKDNDITDSSQPISFPVRAGIAANSRKQILNLLNSFNDTRKTTITIWSSVNDYVDITKLRMLIYTLGFDRVYLDVPEEIASQLHLDKGTGNSGSLPPLLNITVITLCLLIAKLTWFRE